MAYLGKISAVLAANTQDFTRGIRAAGQELQRFQKQASGLRLNLDSNALDKTLTHLQRFEKTIQEIKKQIAANPGQQGLFPDPKRLQEQFKAFENIGKPLTELKNKIEGLSQTMQAGLYPELGKIQAGFQNLYRGIQSGSTTYDKETARIERLIGALNRLQKTASAASDFGDLTKKLTASNTGASFYQPRAKESLQDSLALRTRAEAVPARFRGGVFADLAAAAEENAQKIEAQAARILQIQNRIGSAGPVTPMSLLQARGQSQDNLDRLTSRQEFFNSAYRKELRSAEIQQIVSPGSDSAVDSLTQRFASLSATLRGISGTQFEPLIGSVGRVVEQLSRGAASAEKAKAAIEKLAAAGRGTQLVGRMEDQAISSLRTKQSLDRETIRRQGQIERSSAPFQGEMGPLTEKQQRKRDAYLSSSQTRQDAGLAREDFNRTMLPRFEDLQKAAEGTGDTRAIKQAQDMIRLANQMDASLRKAFSSQDPKFAAQNLAKFQAELAGILPALDRAEKKIKTLADAQRQYGMFVSASGGRGDKLDPVLEGAASDIMTARQFRGQYSDGNLKGRVAVSQEILRVEGEILRLTKIRQLIEDKPGLSNDKRAKAYERNRKEIEAETQALLKLTAAQSGGVFREERVLAAAQRARKNTGSFSVAGSASAQLALQQGLFAVDDFISSTGGIEYKLRAIGNNITQLGLLLGQSGLIPGLSATTGLFVGLAAVMGGQALSAMMRWASGTENTELSIKAMNDSLARQKSLVESLSQAFRSLGESTLRGAYSEGGERDAGFKKQVEDIRQKQVDLRRERAAGLDETVQKERVEQSKLAKRLEGTSDVGQRVALTMSIEQSRAREKEAADRALARASTGVSPDAIERALLGTIRTSEFIQRDRFAGMRLAEEDTDARRQRASGDVAGAFGDAGKLEEIVRQRMDERRVVAERDLGIIAFEENPEILRAREDVAALEKLLSSIRDVVQQQKIDDASNEIAASSRSAAEEIGRAHKEVAKAIELGLPGARLFALELDASATKLDEANRKLERAASGKRADGTEITTTAEKAALVDSAKAEVASVAAQRERIQAQSDAYRRERVVDPQRQIDARASRASSNLESAGLGSGRIARRMREIESERETLRQQSSRFSGDPMTQRLIQQSETALGKEIIAIEAATIAIKAFADALNRASEEAKGNLNSAQQAADEARRADLGSGTPRTQDARRQANSDLERQREIERQTQTEIAVERDRLEQIQRPDANRIRQINERLNGGMPFNREALIREREALKGKIDDDARASQARIDAARDASTREEEQRKAGIRGRDMSRTPAEQFIAESEQGFADIQTYFERRAEANNGLRPDGDVKAQADAEARFRRDRDREARTATAAGRGRELGMDERERFRRDMEEGPVADLTAAAKEMQAKGQDPSEFLRRGIRNQKVAPMLEQFQEERQNAILQGPSRAALQVSDVSTTQGASELTRLLRGDDSAKDVNLAELQKQTQKFDDLIEAVKAANPGVLL
jgi:hypothetical protein